MGWRAFIGRLGSDRRLRFLVVGAYNTAFGYVFFAIAYLLFGERLHYLAIGVACHFIAVTHSFLTQRYLVFRSRGPWLGEYGRFQLAYLATLPFGVGLLALFHDLVGLPVLWAQACALAVLVVYTYLASSRFAFRDKNPAAGETGGSGH
jgi:putative flippase GtrA